LPNGVGAGLGLNQVKTLGCSTCFPQVRYSKGITV